MGHAKWVNSMDKFKNQTKQKIRTQSWVSQKKKETLEGDGEGMNMIKI